MAIIPKFQPKQNQFWQSGSNVSYFAPLSTFNKKNGFQQTAYPIPDQGRDFVPWLAPALV
jgi:hypothetical protein